MYSVPIYLLRYSRQKIEFQRKSDEEIFVILNSVTHITKALLRYKKRKPHHPIIICHSRDIESMYYKILNNNFSR
jgi:hypothetical protein